MAGEPVSQQGGTHHSCVEAREREGVEWIADSGLLISTVVPRRVRVVAPLSISSESILCPFCAPRSCQACTAAGLLVRAQ